MNASSTSASSSSGRRDFTANPIHGLMLVNKASGITSHDLVAKLRRILGTSAVGHCGTLDPIARGLMIMLVGDATKLSQYILEGNKSYQVDLQLGVRTDTFDRTGKILEEKPVEADAAKVESVGLQMVGEKNWPVPVFSAVKVGGQKLYEYARAEEAVQVPMKIMKFWQVEKREAEAGQYSFHLHCSKGSYIRTWVEELGKALGCGAMMTGLLRTGSEPYRVEQAQTLEEIAQDIQAGRVPRAMIPMDQALPSVKKVRVALPDQALLRNGQIAQGLRVLLFQIFDVANDKIVQAIHPETGRTLALIGFEPNKGFVLRRVMA